MCIYCAPSEWPSKLVCWPSLARAASSDPPLRASNDHRFIVGVPRAQRITGAALPLPFPCFRACSSFSLEGGLFGLPLRASNEGLLRPRVARAQETIRPVYLLSGISSPPYTPFFSGRDGKVPNRAHRGTTFRSGASASERDLPSCPPFPSLDCPFRRLL